MPILPLKGTSTITQHRCGCWSQSPASEVKLIIEGLSQSAMDFQLPFERWPWNSVSCEICCREVRENRKPSVDSFKLTALNTCWIFQWWHLIASGICCGGLLHWAEWEKEEETRSGWELAIREMQSQSSHSKKKKFLPPSYLTVSSFSIYREPRGPKAQRGLYFF